MMEHLGYAAMTETPLVIIDVQRAGPSTGLPTAPAQADMMQARWGSHGDYGIIALCPNSPQECFDLTIRAFNLAEQYRIPVLLMMDECVGHMIERVVIPGAEEIEIVDRGYYSGEKKDFALFKANERLVPPMVKAGDGFHIHVTGLTHDERGYPDMSVSAHDRLIRRLAKKIEVNARGIIDYKEEHIDDADVVLVTYGITSRVAVPAMEWARKDGMKVGHLRLITAWPFPERRIAELAHRVKAFVVPEINLGQMVHEVERVVKGKTTVVSVPHAGGTVHDPEEIYTAIRSCMKGRW